MMPEDIKTRLASVKKKYYGDLSLDDVPWLIDQLEQALAREKRYREALKHYAQDEYILSGQDYQCAGTSSYREAYVEDGGEIAREALQSSAQGKGE